MLLADRPPRTALEVDLSTGPASSVAGMRRLIAALADARAGFGDLPRRHPAEWGRLTRPSLAKALAWLALSASERRLHRESEQTFRVLVVAAAAVCRGAESLGATVVLRGLGRTDLPSLRALGLPVDASDLRVTADPPAHPDHEALDAALSRTALDGTLAHGLISARATARGAATGLLHGDWTALPEDFCPAGPGAAVVSGSGVSAVLRIDQVIIGVRRVEHVRPLLWETYGFDVVQVMAGADEAVRSVRAGTGSGEAEVVL